MTLRSALDALASRIAPGLGGRALVLTSLGTFLLLLYHYEGSPAVAPAWFLEGAAAAGLELESLRRHLWGHLSAVVLLLVVPLAYARLAEGWGPVELGLGVRGAHRELVLVLVLWAVMTPMVFAVADGASFQAMYPRVPEARHDASVYVLHHALYLVKWIAWEFFFRGFFLFGLGRDFVGRAALVSNVAFALMHMGKPEAEALGAIVAGLVLSWLALRSRSIWPGVLLHWMVSATMDLAAAQWWR